MKYSVEFKKSAAKTLLKLPQSVQKRIIDKLSEIENSPPPSVETKLKGNNPFHRIRLVIIELFMKSKMIFWLF